MLNPFPDLLSYSLLSPLLLRVVVGLIFINLGVAIFKGEKERWVTSLTALNIKHPLVIVKTIGILEIALGAILIAGLYTQIAALILAIFTFAETYIEYKTPEILKRNFVFYILLLVILLSLLFSGAGAFALDLPL